MKARLAVLLAAVLWSTAGAALKSSSLSGWELAFGRSLVAALALFALLPASRRLPTRKQLFVSIGYAATVVLFVLANKKTTAANAIFIQDSAPLWVMLLSPFVLKEKPSRSELLAAPIFFGGLALFFLGELSPGAQVGNLLALGSGIAFAATILGLRWLGSDGLGTLVWGNLFATAVALPFVVGKPIPAAADLGIILFLGVFQLALAYAAFSWGLRHVPAIEASLLVLLEPVLNPVWTFLLTDEVPTRWALAGGGLILLATLWRIFAPTPTPVAKAVQPPRTLSSDG